MLWWVATPVLLVAVAIHHLWRVRSIDQSAWKGGGFGMFSEPPRCSLATTLWIATPEGAVESIDVDPQSVSLRLLWVPSERSVRRWANAVAIGKWVRAGEWAQRCSATGTESPLNIQSVCVRHLRLDFDGRVGAYTARELKRYVLRSTSARG